MKILPWLLVLAACTSLEPHVTPDAPAHNQTLELHTTTFQQAPGETYHCWYFHADPSNQAIAGFHPVTGAGVHHLALFFEPNGSVRPDRECSSFGQWSLVWGAGVGTGDTTFPAGIAVPLRSDGVYVLQVHILNATDQTLAVEAGVDLALTAPATAYTRAGTFLAGNVSFTVPALAQGYTVTTDCTGRVPDNANLVGLFPHMHRLGARFRTDLVSGSPTSLYDQPWQFDAQTLTMFEPLPLVHATDTLEIRCTYDNPNAYPVSFGLSTTDEMCFAAFYYMPATVDEIDCIQ